MFVWKKQEHRGTGFVLVYKTREGFGIDYSVDANNHAQAFIERKEKGAKILKGYNFVNPGFFVVALGYTMRNPDSSDFSYETVASVQA